MTAKALFEKLKGRYFKRTLSALGIILLAGLLIEIVALVQYNYAHSLLEEELDNRTESEMTLKAVRVRGILRSHESMTRNYLWPIPTDFLDKIENGVEFGQNPGYNPYVK